MKCFVTAIALVSFVALYSGCGSNSVADPPQAFSVDDDFSSHRPPQCEKCSYLTCSIMSARIRNKLISEGCTFHQIFTALYSFQCAFFAGEPSEQQQRACTNAVASMTCTEDGLVLSSELPKECTDDLGIPTDVRY